MEELGERETVPGSRYLNWFERNALVGIKRRRRCGWLVEGVGCEVLRWERGEDVNVDRMCPKVVSCSQVTGSFCFTN
jgi:hypothetical protein